MRFKLTNVRFGNLLHVSLYFAILIVATGLAGYWQGMNTQQQKQTTTAEQKSDIPTTLRIDANLAGIAIHGDPACDSGKLKQTTPYYCKLDDKQPSTTLIADTTLEKDGKYYQFLTWDGCDYAHESKNICMVSGRLGKQKNARATYVEGKKPVDTQPSVSLAAPNTDTPAPPNTPLPSCSRNELLIGDTTDFTAKIIAKFNPDYLRDQTMYYCAIVLPDGPTGFTMEGGAAPFSRIFARCVSGKGLILSGGACSDPFGNDGTTDRLMTLAVRTAISDTSTIVVIGQPMYMFEPHATTHAADDSTYVKWGLDLDKITVTAQPNDPDSGLSPYRYTINFPGKIICTTIADRPPACPASE